MDQDKTKMVDDASAELPLGDTGRSREKEHGNEDNTV